MLTNAILKAPNLLGISTCYKIQIVFIYGDKSGVKQMESTSYIIQGHFIGLQIFSDLLEQKGSTTFIPVSALMVIRRFYSPSYTAQNFLSVSDTHPCREATGWVPLYPVKDFMVLFMPCQAPPNHRCSSAPPLCRATGHRG